MKTKKPMRWMGAAVLAAAVFAAAMWTGSREETAPAPVHAPDLFSFVKPLQQVAADETAGQGVPQAEQYEPPGQERAATPARLTPAQLVATEQAVREMRAQGASEDAIYRLRAMALTAEAAAQLARMDREETAWKARVDAYLAERSKFATENRGLETDPDVALQNLRDAHFTAEEQQRLNAYEPPMEPRPLLQ